MQKLQTIDGLQLFQFSQWYDQGVVITQDWGTNNNTHTSIQKQNLSYLQSLEKDNRVFENTLIFF